MAKDSVEVEVEGIERVAANLTSKVKDVNGAVESVVSKFAMRIVRDAKRNAPVDTGRLRASIRAVLEDLAARIVAGGDIAGSEVIYAAVQEFGWPEKNIPATRYMQKAVENHIDDFQRAIRHATKRAL